VLQPAKQKDRVADETVAWRRRFFFGTAFCNVSERCHWVLNLACAMSVAGVAISIPVILILWVFPAAEASDKGSSSLIPYLFRSCLLTSIGFCAAFESAAASGMKVRTLLLWICATALQFTVPTQC
jgi:hypothetical protein